MVMHMNIAVFMEQSLVSQFFQMGNYIAYLSAVKDQCVRLKTVGSTCTSS